MGEMPRWYLLIKAAQFLGVPPWDLLDKPAAWIDIAITAMNAESHAQEMQNQRRSNLGP